MIIIKKILRENTLTKHVYLKLAGSYSRIRLEKEKEYFLKNSANSLQFVQEALNKIDDALFFFMFGTALGAYRDKKLLKNDMDIDVGIYIDSVTNCVSTVRKQFASSGFNMIHYYEIDNVGVIQDSFSLQGIKVDVAYLRRKELFDYCYLLYDDNMDKNKVLMFPFSRVTDTVEYDFQNIKIRLPKNPELYLSETYGNDWRIPNPNYKYWENPNAKKTNQHGRLVLASN